MPDKSRNRVEKAKDKSRSADRFYDDLGEGYAVALQQLFMLILCIAAAAIVPMLGGCASAGTPGKISAPAGWQTYRNDKIGYQINYPAGWDAIEAAPRTTDEAIEAKCFLIEKEIQKVTFVEEGNEFWPGEFQICVLSNPTRADLDRWVENYDIEDVGGGSLIQEKTPTTLSGKPAYKLTVFGFDHQGTDIISTTDNGDILYISFEGKSPNDPEFTRHLRIYKRMLGSFRF
jgi:hypothetical protein